MHQRSGFCESCGERQYVTSNGINYALHLLFAICTMGLWPLACKSLSIPNKAWKCTACGKNVVTSVRKSSSRRQKRHKHANRRFVMFALGIVGIVLAIILFITYMIQGKLHLLSLSLAYIIFAITVLYIRTILLRRADAGPERYARKAGTDDQIIRKEALPEPAEPPKPQSMKEQPPKPDMSPKPAITTPISVKKQKKKKTKENAEKRKKKEKRKAQRKARKKKARKK